MSALTIVLLIAGVACLVLGAEALIRGAARLAARTGMSSVVIGLTVVAFGTSAPELAVSIGDVLGGGGGEEAGIRVDADAAEVEAVGVEADGEGWFGLGWAAVVDLAGGDEEIHTEVVELEMASLTEIEGELRSAGAVFRVGIFIVPAGVVKDGEETDDFLIGIMMTSEVEAVAAHGEPVGRAVVGMRIEPELGGDEIPERVFGGSEHRG